MSTLKTNTIQAATGSTVNIASGNVLQAPGHVLQVIQGESTAELDVTSTSFIDLGLNASITPSSTSSKIWIMYDVIYNVKAGDRGCGTQLMRDSTALITGQPHEIYIQSASEYRGRSTYHYLDSPSTTSAINYKIQVKVYAGGQCRFCNDSHAIHITLMEIAQ